MLVNQVQKFIREFFKARGYDIVRHDSTYSREELDIAKKVEPVTATTNARLVALIDAVKYLVENKIEGDFVECGVWRGGSMMAAMYALLNLKNTSYHFHLFDTYEGMSAPSQKDVMFDGQKASDILRASEKIEGPANYWCVASLETVQRNVSSTGYPKDKIHFIKGRVEETLPKHAPGRIALLRLDTDWYESTKHELIHLYPRLCDNGVLLIDDYGHWKGARQAVDEFFAGQKFRPLLQRVDYSGRVLIKPSAQSF
jgi:hypothetical protein